MKIESATQNERKPGDAVVSGLLHGQAAGLAMAAYLVMAGLPSGEGPSATLARFDPDQAASPLIGLLAHLAVSGIYGLIFGLGWHLLGLRAGSARLAWLVGPVYGLLLWLLAELALLPGAPSSLQAIPAFRFALAHGVYGLALGALAHGERRSKPDGP